MPRKAFRQKFDDLDRLLTDKLKELEMCAMSEKNAEEVLRQAQARLEWLKDIQTRVNTILDI